jgi:hypothetical protein
MLGTSIALHAVAANRAQQSCVNMQGVRAKRDHAMCNSQNRTIPVAQLIQFQELSFFRVSGTGILNGLQECRVLQY